MRKNRLQLMALILAILLDGSAFGARVADVRGTLHNFSSAADGTATPSGGAVPTRNIKAATENQICVFCHTPHGATAGIPPLWNRTLSGAAYTVYTSSSLDAEAIKGGPLGQPGGSSKLCLSCHDGTLAIGSVNVLNGAASQTINMTGGPNMPVGNGATTGFTRNLGIDLTNDHPISVSYTNALALRDGELRQVDVNQQWPNGTGEIIGVRSSGYKPKAPLETPAGGGDAQIQCATCHDPHMRETDATVGNQKFLRLNRFQESAPNNTFTAGNSTSGDIICLACHERGGASWAYSAHANPLVATPTYTTDAANRREFPASLPVWKAACLNCHDTHTVQGSRRLLREGTDSTNTTDIAAAAPQSGGGVPAIEETCYQCHSSTSTVVTPTTNIPAIKQDFALTVHMPITNTEQGNTTEVHDIGGGVNDPGGVDCSGATNKCGADFVEQRSKLGFGNPGNRHAECTDCHNPHRVVKFKDFRGANASGSLAGAPDASGTHPHTETSGYTHTNIASGVLRGTYGVEPVYSSSSFYSMPSSFDVKRGDPGTNTNTATSATYVTREYQICLKCHSNYAYNDNNVYPQGTRPDLGSTGGSTPSGTNGMTQFTNQAKEFQAPLAHQGLTGSPGDSGAFRGIPAGQAYSVDFQTNNRRGWHPVMNPTGRSSFRGYQGKDITNASFMGIPLGSAFLAPWNNAVGTQTMYCSDCHGSNTAAGTAIPTGGENGNPWGPHGSSNNFLLKGTWSSTTAATTNTICFKCHNSDAYINTNNWSTPWSGFSGPDSDNLHLLHLSRVGGKLICTWCHVAIPHGWKNKMLLVNLNDLGPEAICQQLDIDDGVNCTLGQPMLSGTQVRDGPVPNPGPDPNYWGNGGVYNNPPYYASARLKVINFKTSGNWIAGDCGSVGAPGVGLSGMCGGWAWSSEGCTANFP